MYFLFKKPDKNIELGPCSRKPELSCTRSELTQNDQFLRLHVSRDHPIDVTSWGCGKHVLETKKLIKLIKRLKGFHKKLIRL